MITVIIKNDGEDKVVQLTYKNIWKELKDIPGAQILVSEDWFHYLPNIETRYVCFVEADCLVNSGYFTSQLGLIKKDPMLRKLAVMASATGVNNWANKFYGYNVGNNHNDGIIPNKAAKSKIPYPVQIAYIPGAVIHTAMLRRLVGTEGFGFNNSWCQDLVFLSTRLSLGFWRQGIGNGVGNRVHINPNATYVTTEDYVNDISEINAEAADLVSTFSRQSI